MEIKVLYSYLGNNTYTPLEGCTYTGAEYLCCLDNKINGKKKMTKILHDTIHEELIATACRHRRVLMI